MALNLSGKVVAITGGFGVLGQAVSATLAARGAQVALVDHAAVPTGAPPPAAFLYGGVDLADEARAHVLMQRIVSVLPSILDTPRNRLDMPDADTSRWVAPSAVAEDFEFLLSDAASAVTGSLIPVADRV
jgi:NAD(P)-dependent dehydrogenase (short-subunit alcohol dehydrogenase family)